MSRTQNAEGKQGGWPAAGLGVRVGAPWGNHAGYYVLLSKDSEVVGVQRGSAGEDGLRRLVERAGL